MMEEVKLLASDHTMLYVHCWRAEQPKATILLAHGDRTQFAVRAVWAIFKSKRHFSVLS